MSKAKLFVENFLIYGLGGIISKLIPLIMVPIVTRIMPATDYFGISDLSNTVVSFGSAVAVMGMYDAMYRMFFEQDEENYKKTVCSTALAFTCFTSVLVFISMLLCRNIIAQYFFSDKQYAHVVYLSAMATLVGATNSIISAPTRMQNKRKVYLITNAVSPLLSYSISIPLLLAGHYTIALPLAAAISGVTMEMTFGVMNRQWFRPRMFNKKLLKQLLLIAIPLLPNFLIYWVFNSCDKVMITNMVGIGAAGIYSVGSKLGHTSQLIYTAFAGGWQYFAFSTMKEKNQVKSNSMIFEYLGIISFVATGFICAWSYEIFKLLFKAEYLSGYIVAPYLFLAPLLQMLFQVAGNQFLVVKKTWPNMFILLSGAVLNVIINYLLIPVLGIEGASIATLAGYVVSDIICVIVLCRMKLMVVSKKFVAAAISMVTFMLIWRIWFSNLTIIGTTASLALSGIMFFLYKDELSSLLNKTKKKRNSPVNALKRKPPYFALRKLKECDAPYMLEWMHDLSVVKNLQTDFMKKTEDDCLRFIKHSQKDERNIHLAIVDDGDEYQGTVSLKNVQEGAAEFAIIIRSSARGSGIASIAMEEIIKIGFEVKGLKFIYWCVSPKNGRAVRFYDKNGYTRIYSDQFVVRGYSRQQIQSYLWYQISKRDWMKRNRN